MKESIFDKILREMRLRQIKAHLSEFENIRLLDVGCGWEARLLKAVEPFIAKGIGIDFKAPNINSEKLHTFSYFFEPKDDKFIESNLNCIKNSESATGGGDLSKIVSLPFENESFEVVCMLAVIEHLNYPLLMLKEIKRVLIKNGILLITAPSHASKPVLEFLSYKLHLIDGAEIKDHKRYYNKADLEHCANEAGLRMEMHKYFQFGFNNFAKIRKN